MKCPECSHEFRGNQFWNDNGKMRECPVCDHQFKEPAKPRTCAQCAALERENVALRAKVRVAERIFQIAFNKNESIRPWECGAALDMIEAVK